MRFRRDNLSFMIYQRDFLHNPLNKRKVCASCIIQYREFGFITPNCLIKSLGFSVQRARNNLKTLEKVGFLKSTKVTRPDQKTPVYDVVEENGDILLGKCYVGWMKEIIEELGLKHLPKDEADAYNTADSNLFDHEMLRRMGIWNTKNQPNSMQKSEEPAKPKTETKKETSKEG